MSFFQNPFNEEYQGFWVLGDRQHSLTFKCPANTGRGSEIIRSYEPGPYDMDGTDGDGNNTDTLTISFAIDGNFKNYVDLSIDVTSGATSTSAVTQQEVVEALNDNSTFATYFIASVPVNKEHIEIKTKRDANRFRFYVKNDGAETLLKFNKFAGVAELPSYFSRHTIASRYDFNDSVAHLILLNPGSSNVDADIIDNAVDHNGNSLGFSSSDVSEDWELLEGRSGLFVFQKITVDSSDRVTKIIEYHAGANVGDMARTTSYSYDGTNTKPSEIAEIPYTLQSGDLITP